jgi:SPP1 family predicted phage head-tail adaptor
MTGVGAMRDRVKVQSRTTLTSELGEAVADWATDAVRWAKVEPISGGELWRARQVQAESTHTVTLRFYPGLTTRHRIVLGSRVLEILNVIDRDGEGRFSECLCVERV